MARKAKALVALATTYVHLREYGGCGRPLSYDGTMPEGTGWHCGARRDPNATPPTYCLCKSCRTAEQAAYVALRDAATGQL